MYEDSRDTEPGCSNEKRLITDKELEYNHRMTNQCNQSKSVGPSRIHIKESLLSRQRILMEELTIINRTLEALTPEIEDHFSLLKDLSRLGYRLY